MQISSPNFKRIALAFAVLFSVLLSRPTFAVEPAVRLSVTPNSVGLTADQTATLQVTAYDAKNVATDVTGVTTFTTSDPRGSFSGATYNPGKVGLWTIGVKAEGLNASVAVTVTAGKLAELQINPNSTPERVALTTTRTYTITGFDADNNIVAVDAPVWSVTKERGTITATGVFTPTDEGTGSISVTSGSVTTSVQLEVYKRPAVVLGPITNTSNSNANSNTNTSTNINSTTNSPASDTPITSSCSARKNWLWGLILLAILGGSALLFAFVSVTKIWPAAIVLGVAALAAILEHRYGCGNAWWSWIVILGSAALTGFAYQQAPKQE